MSIEALRTPQEADQALRDRMVEAKRLGIVRRPIDETTAMLLKNLIRRGEVSKKQVITFYGVTYKQLKVILNG